VSSRIIGQEPRRTLSPVRSYLLCGLGVLCG
jgi:hypothetical protein